MIFLYQAVYEDSLNLTVAIVQCILQPECRHRLVNPSTRLKADSFNLAKGNIKVMLNSDSKHHPVIPLPNSRHRLVISFNLTIVIAQ